MYSLRHTDTGTQLSGQCLLAGALFLESPRREGRLAHSLTSLSRDSREASARVATRHTRGGRRRSAQPRRTGTLVFGTHGEHHRYTHESLRYTKLKGRVPKPIWNQAFSHHAHTYSMEIFLFEPGFS